MSSDKPYSIDHHKRLNKKKAAVFGKKKSVFKKKAKVLSDDRDYLSWLKDNDVVKSQCFVCGSDNVQFHHIKRDSTDKKDHKRVIPLCSKHHTGWELSPHGTPARWREVYPMQVQYDFADGIYKMYLESKQ